MRILVFHQYYLRAGEGGGPRFNVMCREWASSGHEVEVVAGQVHYATGARLDGGWLERDDDGPVRVWRAYTPSGFHRSFVGRAAAFAGYAGAAAAAVASGRLSRPDVVVATSPSLLAWIPGLVAKARWGAPLVLEARDLWPESAVDMGVLAPGSALTRALYAFERAAVGRADAFVGLTPAITADTVARGLVEPARAHVMTNGAGPGLLDADLEEGRAEERALRGWGDDDFVAVYAGAHGRANRLGQLVEAARVLERVASNVRIVCVGAGPEKAALVESARDLGRIEFEGPLGSDAIGGMLRAADCGLAVLARAKAFLTVYPNKVFDYMACGLPCLVAIDGAARALVEGEGAGVFVEPESPEALARALDALAADRALARSMGARGRALAASRFDRREIANEYEVLLRGVSEVGR